MSKKNLARTAIEGGRSYYNCWERRQSNGWARAAVRAWLRSTLRDPEYGLAKVIPERVHVSKRFHDKLNPTESWMAAQVGQKWDDVYGALKRRFDSRTTAGRHILYDHMLSSVAQSPNDCHRYHYDYRVDAEGILRFGEDSRRNRRRKPIRDPGIDPRGLDEWMRGRKVGARGPELFWFVKVVPRDGGDRIAYRQHQKLTVEETIFWNALVERRRQELRIEVEGSEPLT